jgi:chromosome segregation ATPase
MKSLVIMEIKPMTENCAGCTYASRGKHFHTMTTKIDELFATLRILISDQSRDLAMAMAELRTVAAERDSANWSLSRAKESLRAAEQDAAETESANSDLRTVNARLVADLAAAVQRADTAEELFACAGLRGRY